MGKLIVIDGLDGSGKTTKSKLLYEELKNQGKNVRLISFPNYESEEATLVKMYLRGDFGDTPDAVNGYAAATFFSVERYASFKKSWESFYREDDAIVIACRYTTANAVHQLAKMDRDLWDEYLNWLYDFEYNKMGIPRPDLVLFLEMKPEVSEKLVAQRNAQTGQALDIHEKDKEYMQRCYKAGLYSSDKLGWERICCYEGNEPKSVEELMEVITEKVTMFLDVTKN